MSANSNKAKSDANRARVLAALTKIAKAGEPTPSHAALAEAVGMAVGTVIGHVKALAECGDIDVVNRDGGLRQIIVTSTGDKTDMCVPGKPPSISGPDVPLDRFLQILAGMGRFEDDPRATARDTRRVPMRPATIVAGRMDAYAA